MKLTAGNNPPQEINAYIEIPQGSCVKYELDKDSELIIVDRFLYTASVYPFNYGFIPETKAEDGDPLDILVLSSTPVFPGIVLPSRPIGLLEMEDEEGIDTKLIAVPMRKIDPNYKKYQDVSDVNEATKNKIKHFFETYKTIEPGKWVKVKNWKGKEAAEEEIKKGLKRKQ